MVDRQRIGRTLPVNAGYRGNSLIDEVAMSDTENGTLCPASTALPTLDPTIRQHLGKQLQSRLVPVFDADHGSIRSGSSTNAVPRLDATTRERLGQQLQALYEPVFDRAIDPRLIEMLQQLDRDREK